MSDEQQRDDRQAADPWGLPTEGERGTTWPESEEAPPTPPEEAPPEAEEPEPEEPEPEEPEPEPEPEPVGQEPEIEGSRPEEQPGQPDSSTVREAFQQVAETPAEPGVVESSEDLSPPSGEEPEPEESPATEATPPAERDPATEEPTHASPFEASPGPLSQALAAAKNVISSLQETPPEGGTPDQPAEPAEPPEAASSAGAGTAGVAEPTAEDEESPTPPADLPDEPPPWLEEEGEEKTAAPISLGPEEEPSEEPARSPFGEEAVQQPATERPEEEPAVEEVPSEEMLIEVDEEAAEEDLERLAAQLAEYADEPDEEPEPEETHLEEPETELAEPDVEGAEPTEPEAEEEVASDPVDTTPSAYAELASMTDERPEPVREEPAARQPPDEPAEEPPAEEPPAEEPPEEPAREESAPVAAADQGASAEGGPRVEMADAPSVEWGALWNESAQGWVEDEDGNPTWRPIVTTTPALADWDVDTYLGVVTGEVLVAAPGQTGGIRGLAGGGAGGYEKELARARAAAVRSLVEAAVARGGHAVVGVEVSYAPVGDRLLVGVSGTAVTLKTRS